MFKYRLNTRGDTIVEVLIALAVCSLLLGGAFATTTRSLAGARQSQERGEALKIAESQAEALRSMPSPGTATAPFCFDPATFATILIPATPGIASTAAGDQTAKYAGYPAGCVSGFFHISIVRPIPATLNKFDIRVRWDRAGGGGAEELIITYAAF